VLQSDSPRRITRRTALQLGAAAGAAATAAPYLGRLGNVFGADGAAHALMPNPNWPAPSIITRAQWGANEAIRKGGQIYDSPVSHIIVHHTGTPNSVTDYVGLIRGIYSNEVAGEYIDIAYNWLIDPVGRIYEGRWAQDYAAGQVHTGEHNGANVHGGHAIYHNTDTIGIALMGNYDLIPPAAAMINSLVNLITWKCARWGIDPNARVLYHASNGPTENLQTICGHRDTSATACPGAYVENMLPAIRGQAAARLSSGGGYWIAGATGQVLAFGGVPAPGGVTTAIAGIGGTPSGNGYWLAAPDGAVFAKGGAQYHGGMNGHRLNQPIVGIQPTHSGNGYWLVAKDGGIFSFGDAKFFGSTGSKRLNAPMLGVCPTGTGRGYWLYARDGGIFSFGDARFHGSTGGMRLNQPIVSMAPRPQGDGYWLVAADGGVFCFGNARFRGSGANTRNAAPCIGMLPSTTGNGYVILRQDGMVQSFGDAPNLGDARGLLAYGAVGIAGHLKPL